MGVLLGFLWPEAALELKFLVDIFLRLIKMVIVPLLFATLVTGIAGHSDDLKELGRLGIKAFIYFEVVTTLALAIGLVTTSWLEPGRRLAELSSSPQVQEGLSPNSPGFVPPASSAAHENVLTGIFPESFFAAAAENNILQVVVFSVLFGVALTRSSAPGKQAVLDWCAGISEVMFPITQVVMRLAPLAITAAVAWTIAKTGWNGIVSSAQLLATLVIALLLFVALVFVPILWLWRIPLKGFWRAVRSPALIAFGTTSSEAALPEAMKRLIEFGVPQRIASLILPLGYSFNLDGTTLYLAVASLFLAQSAGIHLSLSEKLLLMATLLLTSKGVAAVPRASLAVLAGTLSAFHIPSTHLTLIIGVDVYMDMTRTMVNLVGNCLASAVIARSESHKSPEDLNSPEDLFQ